MIEALRHQIIQTEGRFRTHEAQRKERQTNLATLNNGGDWRKVDAPERIARRLELLAAREITPREIIGEAPVSVSTTEIEEVRRAEDPAGFNPLERIIAENNLLGVVFLINGARISRSVGRIVIRDSFGRHLGYGTGFMVSPRLLMTNNHVLGSRFSAANSRVQFNYFEPVPGQPNPPIEFGLQPEVFFETDQQLDFTLVAVQPRNATGQTSRSRGWNPMLIQSGKAVVGERVNIIQHPGGAPLQLAIHDNTIIDVLDHFLHYSTDTNRGSSGSPVFNDQWEVAALHHSGVPDRDAQGRILTVDGEPWDGRSETISLIAWKANEGVRISQIVEHCRAKSSSFTNAQRQLFEQVFEDCPPLNELEDTPSPSSSPPPSHGGARVDDQGYVYFTIPVEIRVGLDQGQIKLLPPEPDAPPAEPPTDEEPPAPPVPPDMQDLLDTVAGCAGAPYYDAADDEADRDGYYGTVASGNIGGATLFRRLNTLLTETHTTVLSYSDARLKNLYPCVDLHPDRKLRSIYSGEPFDAEELIRRDLEIAAEHQIQLQEFMARESFLNEEAIREHLDLLEAQDPFNCEHVVPQSWFNKAQPMKADLHHLFACEPGCNSFRSNIPYFDFPLEEEAFRTECGRREDSRFEPEASKGVVARATLYFILRYPGFMRLAERRIVRERLPTLLDWHQTHEVADYERHRNAGIFTAQGNRNPLIDHPDWADRIDFTVGLEG